MAIKKISISKKIISKLLTFVLIFTFIASDVISVQASSTKVVPISWSSCGLKKFPYDSRFGTSLTGRYKYENGKIYAQLEMGTWRSSGWDHVWLMDRGRVIRTWDMSRADRANGATDVYYRDGRTVYRRELDWVQLEGVKPEKPKGYFSRVNSDYFYDCTSSSNGAAYLQFDYSYSDSKGTQFVPEGGTLSSIEDYITGFYYSIDTNPNGDVSGSSPFCTNGKIKITDYVTKDPTTYYLHLRSRSYTGKLSDKLDVKIAKVKVVFHSEDDKHNVSKIYVYGAPKETFVHTNEWWRSQKVGYTWIGWSEKKNATEKMYVDGQTVDYSWIALHEGKTVDLYNVWKGSGGNDVPGDVGVSAPGVIVEPTSNNISYKNHNITYYKNPVELQVKGYNSSSPVTSVSIWTKKSNSLTESAGSSCIKTFDKSHCFQTDIITVYGQAKTSNGVSGVASKNVYIDVTPPNINKCVMDYGQSSIKVGATDYQSGIGTIRVEYFKDGKWSTETTHTTNVSEYDRCDTSIDVLNSNAMYKHRVVVTDHLGNSSYSNDLYIVPLTLGTHISKLNGDTAYNGQTLTYLAGGDLTVFVNARITGYPDYVKYEFANELGQPVDAHYVSCDSSGTVVESKQFTIPWQVVHDKKFYIKITAYRYEYDEELEQVVVRDRISTVEYVELVDIDYSKLRSIIVYQSGQHE